MSRKLEIQDRDAAAKLGESLANFSVQLSCRLWFTVKTRINGYSCNADKCARLGVRFFHVLRREPAVAPDRWLRGGYAVTGGYADCVASAA